MGFIVICYVAFIEAIFLVEFTWIWIQCHGWVAYRSWWFQWVSAVEQSHVIIEGVFYSSIMCQSEFKGKHCLIKNFIDWVMLISISWREHYCSTSYKLNYSLAQKTSNQSKIPIELNFAKLFNSHTLAALWHPFIRVPYLIHYYYI